MCVPAPPILPTSRTRANANEPERIRLRSRAAMARLAWLSRGLIPGSGASGSSVGPHRLGPEQDTERFELTRTATAREANRRASSYACDRKQYARFVESFTRRYLDGESKEMPIFAYYGTNRSVVSVPSTMPEDVHYDQLSALERACDNAADFKRFLSTKMAP